MDLVAKEDDEEVKKEEEILENENNCGITVKKLPEKEGEELKDDGVLPVIDATVGIINNDPRVSRDMNDSIDWLAKDNDSTMIVGHIPRSDPQWDEK